MPDEREHHVLNCTGLALEGCPLQHDVAAIVLGNKRSGGLPEHVCVQMERREGMG